MENVANRNQLYRDLLKGKINVDRGMFFENMIAQELVMTGHGLSYAKFEHEASSPLQEVDFVIADGIKLIPLESKSGFRPFTIPLTASWTSSQTGWRKLMSSTQRTSEWTEM